METYFQRYIDGTNWQSCCGIDTQFKLLETYGCGLNCYQVQLLKDIINGKTVTIEEKHRTSRSLIGKKIMIYDEKKEKAANIIIKYWRKCRYDPRYKMCEKVLMRNIKELESEYNH